MADLSILEFIVYAVIGYSPMIFLMGYILTDKPGTTSNSIMRVVYIMPGMAAVMMLVSAGGFSVTMDTVESTITTTNNVTSDAWVEEGVQSYSYSLENPIWITFNGLVFIIYFIYLIINVLQLIGLDEKFKR